MLDHIWDNKILGCLWSSTGERVQGPCQRLSQKEHVNRLKSKASTEYNCQGPRRKRHKQQGEENV